MPKNGKNGTKIMTYEEMQEVMSYLLQQDAKHESRFTKLELQIARNDERYQKRTVETETRLAKIENLIEQSSREEKKRRKADDERHKKRVREAEERFDKQIKRAIALNTQMTKILAERTEELQAAQIRTMQRTEELAHKIDELVANINKMILNRDRGDRNGNGHKRPSKKK